VKDRPLASLEARNDASRSRLDALQRAAGRARALRAECDRLAALPPSEALTAEAERVLLAVDDLLRRSDP
jgi:small ligand-binding sensory domain FIST